MIRHGEEAGHATRGGGRGGGHGGIAAVVAVVVAAAARSKGYTTPKHVMRRDGERGCGEGGGGRMHARVFLDHSAEGELGIVGHGVGLVQDHQLHARAVCTKMCKENMVEAQWKRPEGEGG